MKTKLLKKVRKRFQIIRYDSIATNAGESERISAKTFGFPFFRITKDENGSYLFFKCTYVGTYDEAYSTLVKWIHDCYSEQFKHKDAKTTKVWWAKQVKK